MTQRDSIKPIITTPVRFSYWFMAGLFILIGALHLATPLLASLFAYLALVHLRFKRGDKWLSVAIFLLLVSAAAYVLGYVINQTIRSLPEIADKAIPSVIQWAKQYQIELPFTDYDSLKDVAMDAIKSQVDYLNRFARIARGATTQLVFLVVGCIVAISLFFHPKFEPDHNSDAAPDNLYSLSCAQIEQRFRTLYQSFATVMGAQVIIAAINAVLTGIFALAVRLPYAPVVIGMTFLCGLLPVIGNIISNTIVVGIGFTVSPRMAITALIFLVVIHKLEYLLNSKIVGWRIHNPLWLTLLALVVGEKLLGIPGIILAPVVLNYIRLEATQIRAAA
jgi:predicted PurR-regulated permease PerM